MDNRSIEAAGAGAAPPAGESLTLSVLGRVVTVAPGQTVLNALRRSHWPDLSGCGCRLGDCGECRITVRRAGEAAPERLLACVAPVEEAMAVLELPFPWTRAFRQRNGGA